MTPCSTQLTAARDDSSGTFNFRMSVYDASHWPLQNASFPGDLKGSFMCPCAPSWLSTKLIVDCINALSKYMWCARSPSCHCRLLICCAGLAESDHKSIHRARGFKPWSQRPIRLNSTGQLRWIRLSQCSCALVTRSHPLKGCLCLCVSVCT